MNVETLSSWNEFEQQKQNYTFETYSKEQDHNSFTVKIIDLSCIITPGYVCTDMGMATWMALTVTSHGMTILHKNKGHETAKTGQWKT